ncbi:hypothetical protein CK203_090788 [Vitis vinifera]|uniref:SET domain-containing protein n=1 Tax=Vitis vinifera TaxID=29760 RepID=A0A438BU10_VITVI|nr:hypothetical protein CK203_090788 [Vitis vinifera]
MCMSLARQLFSLSLFGTFGETLGLILMPTPLPPEPDLRKRIGVNHFCFGLLLRQVEGETRVGVFAARSIKAGEPLTYDYRYLWI